MADILVLYYSASGSVRALAQSVARGIESVDGMRARVRTVPKSGERGGKAGARGAVGRRALRRGARPRGMRRARARLADALRQHGGAAQHFIDGLGPEWSRGTLAGKPAAVFSSTATMHGGQEATLVSMMLPLLHHGMLIVGLPYTEPELNSTRSGRHAYTARPACPAPPTTGRWRRGGARLRARQASWRRSRKKLRA